MMLKQLAFWLVPGSRLSFWLHFLVLGLLTLAGLHLAAWHEYRIGEFFLETHKYAEARQHLERCLVVWSGSVPLKLHLARAERIAGSLDKAEEYLQELRLTSRTLPDTYRIEGLLLMVNQGYVDDAEPKLLEYLRDQHPESPAILETLVMFNLKVRDLNRAFFLLDRWQKLEPNNFLVYELRGNCLALQGQAELAINELEHTLEMNPDTLEARLVLCDMYFSTSKIPALAPHVRFLADHDVDNRGARLIIARYLIELNRFDEADQQLAAILAKFPEDHGALVAQGTSYYRRDDFQQAARYLRAAMAVAPHDLQVSYMLDRCLTALNDPELPAFRARVTESKLRMARLKELTEKLAQAKRKPTLDELVERGQLYLQMGNENAGLRDLSMVIKQSPDLRRVHQILAEYFTSKNNPGAASPHLKKLESLQKQGSSTSQWFPLPTTHDRGLPGHRGYMCGFLRVKPGPDHLRIEWFEGQVVHEFGAG